mmetsp:Transcript_35145/g.106214  ORF Transcript_35145/g.106214 Transcript_35145/m.106214 type:complete len:257 (-) Transcript_35145:167-937(-)|eukprot:CAMPEP_0198519666 /NCGR_PEP_ID=MMETSP1462-20131121/19853_1 /TAXON_ID=1333877 /ORGANISM="Brandtodinium nutriculum, Strain RCC3387" /LENGTH=256 /DNA_ID=CAMNT_0044249281 /DNA_START=85 /DNA_END=855 /DNA_ORIENTATION=-
MGCCNATATLPTTEVFLATAQQKPPEGYLVEDWPTDVKMTGWSLCREHHAVSAAWDEIQGCVPAGTYVGLSGVGQREELAICDLDDRPLGSLRMPKHLSFGAAAILADPAGDPIAMLRTAQKQRPQPFSESSYNVYALRPQFEGQAEAPVAPGWFLWASVKRSPFSATLQVTDGRGARTGQGVLYRTSWGKVVGHGAMQWRSANARGQGVMLCLPTKETPKRHHLRCAPGADVALQVCLMYAANLAFDELYQSGGN